MKNLIPILIVSLFFIFSCGTKPDKETVASMLDSLKEVPAVTPSDSDQFGFKTGVVVYTSSTMGFSQEITMWFDDFGRKTSTEIKSNMLGQRVHQMNIVKDSVVYNVDMISKSGTMIKMRVDTMQENYNYRTLSKDEMSKHNITYTGDEDVLGKKCKVYEQKQNLNGQDIEMKVWIWEGIPLKSVSIVSGIQVTMDAVQFKVNIEIPEAKFDIPAGIEIKEKKDTSMQVS
jgi:hypothetical protein